MLLSNKGILLHTISTNRCLLQFINFCCSDSTLHAHIFGAAQKPQKVGHSFTLKFGLKLGFLTMC